MTAFSSPFSFSMRLDRGVDELGGDASPVADELGLGGGVEK